MGGEEAQGKTHRFIVIYGTGGGGGNCGLINTGGGRFHNFNNTGGASLLVIIHSPTFALSVNLRRKPSQQGSSNTGDRGIISGDRCSNARSRGQGELGGGSNRRTSLVSGKIVCAITQHTPTHSVAARLTYLTGTIELSAMMLSGQVVAETKPTTGGKSA